MKQLQPFRLNDLTRTLPDGQCDTDCCKCSEEQVKVCEQANTNQCRAVQKTLKHVSARQFFRGCGGGIR